MQKAKYIWEGCFYFICDIMNTVNDNFLPIYYSVGINDEAIYRYRINLQEEISSARFSKLATTYKNHARFRYLSVSLISPNEYLDWLNHGYVSQHSGTEVCLCLSNDADVDDLILWLVGFFRKVSFCHIYLPV